MVFIEYWFDGCVILGVMGLGERRRFDLLRRWKVESGRKGRGNWEVGDEVGLGFHVPWTLV